MFTDSPTFPFRVDKSIKSNISAADLRELGNNLWPADCQTCGQPFDGELPALVINDVAVMAFASLHHAKCSPPRWSDNHVINASTAPYLSYRTMTALIPGETSNGRPYAMPTVIVNPALEQVMLRREGTSWSVATLTHYGENCGLTGLSVSDPVPDAHVQMLPAGLLSVTLDRTGESWEFDTTGLAGMTERIRELGGVALAVTSAYLPDQHFTVLGDYVEALRSGQLALGWVALQH